MIEGDRGVVLRQVGALFRAGTFAGMSDGQLLEHFLARGGEAGELAFAVLVERHGPMVLRVCRAALGDRHDAEDAFQATFLALVRGAGAIRCRDSVAPWLHGAALRVSACARTAGARRRRHEGRAGLRRGDHARDPDPEADDLAAVVHEEVARLPARFRAAVTLCDLQGLPLVEAARHLGCPVGTVKSRVARGRDRLRARLARRGVVPTTATALGLAMARQAQAAVGPALAEATARLALRFASGRGTAGMLVSPAQWLARLDHRRLLMARLRSMTAALATLGVLAAGATLLGQQLGRPGGAPAGGEAREAQADRPPLLTKTYAVADLLAAPGGAGGDRSKVDMDPLIDLLASTVAPGTWTVHKALDDDGEGDGPGSIAPHRTNLSLVVRHTPEAHAQFAERLGQLRRAFVAREANTNLGVPLALPPGGPPGAANIAPAAPGMYAGAPGMPMMAGTAAPAAAPAAPGLYARAAPMMVPGGLPAAPAGPAGAIRAGSALPKPAEPPRAEGHVGAPRPSAVGAATYDVKVDHPLTLDERRTARKEAAREAETERRLRSLEEKLDRVLKALDVPKPDSPRGAAGS